MPSNIKNIKGAIFDMDGTLINSLHFWPTYFAELGRRYLGIENFVPDYDTLKFMRTATIENGNRYLYERYKLGDSADEIVKFAFDTCHHFYDKLVTVKDGVFELLDFFKERDIKMCLASATDRHLLEFAVQRFGFDRYFPIVVSCTDVGKSKEFPDVFLRAAALIGTSVNETFVFEDSVVALETSNKAGFGTVGIHDEYGIEFDRMKAVSTYYIDKGHTMAELIPLIKN